MYYTVYKITNNVTGRIYIGVHRTENLNDGYMGSGSALHRSMKKHGIENFSKEILKLCNTADEMFEMESVLVNEEFVRSNETYNVKLGGRSGPINPRNTEYYKSGEHTANVLKARDKALISNSEKKQQRINEYFLNPTKCKHCLTVLDYDKKRYTFCNNSCSASYTNKTRERPSEEHKQKVSMTLALKYTSPETYLQYVTNPKHCDVCNTELPYNRRNHHRCDQECRRSGVAKSDEQTAQVLYNKFRDGDFRSITEFHKHLDGEVTFKKLRTLFGTYIPDYANNRQEKVSFSSSYARSLSGLI